MYIFMKFFISKKNVLHQLVYIIMVYIWKFDLFSLYLKLFMKSPGKGHGYQDIWKAPSELRTTLRRWSMNSYQAVHCLGSCYDHLLKKIFKDCVTSQFLLNFAFYNLSFFLMSNQIFSAFWIHCLCNTALKIWIGNVFLCSFCFISF